MALTSEYALSLPLFSLSNKRGEWDTVCILIFQSDFDYLIFSFFRTSSKSRYRVSNHFTVVYGLCHNCIWARDDLFIDHFPDIEALPFWLSLCPVSVRAFLHFLMCLRTSILMSAYFHQQLRMSIKMDDVVLVSVR